ncbi:molybdate ABC transporter substrate-binding protein [Polaromonas sp. P2-4]|nr:molybdate ABC transporter substrate-binding protein [Polaromonas sp. P2-4]
MSALPAFAQSSTIDGKKALVGAASDLKFALTEIVAQFERETSYRFTLNLGSSGNFAQQIRQGLPIELYLSADEDYVFQLADAGLTKDRGSLYAVGRIALYVPEGSPIKLDPELRGLKEQWASVTKFAIANPEHAPYGRAAYQALQKLGLWDMVQPKLVMGENISQATQFVATGAAQAGITALSLALAQDVASLGKHMVLPAALHAPVRQRMVLTKHAGPAAIALYDYLQGTKAKAILQKYGFAVG